MRFFAVFSLGLSFASVGYAAVPLPPIGPGCDDENADGFLDNAADCPNDYVSCTGNTTQSQCLAQDGCSWHAGENRCEGVEWDYSSFVPQRWLTRLKDPGELTIGSGMHIDRAWQRTTGRFDTLIAVLDCGIRWHEPDLQNKHFLNRNELPFPQDALGVDCGRNAGQNPLCPNGDPYDCNADCVFNVQDYANDPRVSVYDSTPSADPLPHADRCFYPFNNQSYASPTNSILEPGDLICIFSDGVDNDNNGYADDIAGWDFLWDDNNPFDDTDFGHGTGEGRDSTSEGGNTVGPPGLCPNCSLISLRVGDSFVVDANNWAAGVVYATDSGAKVTQSAIGSINATSFSQNAIEYAYGKGVFFIISAGDETAQHQEHPGAGEHGEYVHAVRFNTESVNQANTFLNFSNCTNFGARLLLSASSTGCSSGATGAMAGISGLLASAMTDRVENEAISPLTGPEIHGLFATAIDDINIPDSQPGHPQNDGKRYPSKEGWDMYFGYGRINARKAVDAVLDNKIPPEADILTPKWWDIVDPRNGSVVITGIARTPRAVSGSWALEYAVGVEPDANNLGAWTTIATGNTPQTGDLGQLSLSHLIPLAQSRVEPYNTNPETGGTDDNVTKAHKVNKFTITLRLRVNDNSGVSSEMRKVFYVQADPTWKTGFPKYLGRSLESSPHLIDLNGDKALEIIFGDGDGEVHAMMANGQELPGWPVRTNGGRVARHPLAPAYTRGPDNIPNNGDELDSNVASSIIATVAVGDLEGNGVQDIVVATIDGEVYAWNAAGQLRAGFPISVTGGTTSRMTSENESWEVGIFSTPVLYDLDGDNKLDIIVATLEQQVVAYHDDGTMLSGFPVGGVPDTADPTKPFLRLPFETNLAGQGRRIISSPAVGDLDNDGNPEIVVGTNEAPDKRASLIYAFSYNRIAKKPVAYRADCGTDAAPKRCFPIRTSGAYPTALPYVGEGTPMSPVLADINGDGTLEVGAAAIAEFGRIYEHDGYDFRNTTSDAVNLKSIRGFYGLKTNSGENSSLVLINNGAFGDVDGDNVLDYFVGTGGAKFATNLLVDGIRTDFDHQLAGWSTKTGEMLEGFPQIMEDIQFFLNPLIADVDGDDKPEVINTSGTFVVHAFSADGTEPEGWPKYTGHWQIATPAVGDIDGDGLLEMVVLSRQGWMFVYETTGKADGNVQWPAMRHDARNTGNFETEDPTIALPGAKGQVCEGCCCRELSPSMLAAVLVGFVWLMRQRGRRATLLN